MHACSQAENTIQEVGKFHSAFGRIDPSS